MDRQFYNACPKTYCNFLAVPKGFEPSISALTGPHVRPLHHGTVRAVLYHSQNAASSQPNRPTDKSLHELRSPPREKICYLRNSSDIFGMSDVASLLFFSRRNDIINFR